ncbi:MAG: hypothetical protein IPO94_12505 [Saprospiraceae bacterium]|nr:hypothetical protein [Saprospiraceae bacterium]
MPISKHLKSDLPSGLVVFLVALPLVSIAMAPGAPFIFRICLRYHQVEECR